ncbi:hypothetical protein DIPPA_08814 [Diplonema papillatum]|nr:hypothetical protein DIPPA_08814 [Diplonema papillatum]
MGCCASRKNDDDLEQQLMEQSEQEQALQEEGKADGEDPDGAAAAKTDGKPDGDAAASDGGSSKVEVLGNSPADVMLLDDPPPAGGRPRSASRIDDFGVGLGSFPISPTSRKVNFARGRQGNGLPYAESGQRSRFGVHPALARGLRCRACDAVFPTADGSFCSACGAPRPRGEDGGAYDDDYSPRGGQRSWGAGGYPASPGSAYARFGHRPASPSHSPSGYPAAFSFTDAALPLPHPPAFPPAFSLAAEPYSPNDPPSFDRAEKLLKDACETAQYLQKEIDFQQRLDTVTYANQLASLIGRPPEEQMGWASEMGARSVLEQMLRERNELVESSRNPPNGQRSRAEAKALAAQVRERNDSISLLCTRLGLEPPLNVSLSPPSGSSDED